MVVCGPLYELDDANWHLRGIVSSLAPEQFRPEMLAPYHERVRALLQDRKIVDLVRVHRPDCLQ